MQADAAGKRYMPVDVKALDVAAKPAHISFGHTELGTIHSVLWGPAGICQNIILICDFKTQSRLCCKTAQQCI